MALKLIDINAEKSVIAGLLKYGSSGLAEIDDLLQEATFSTYSNRLLFSLIKLTIVNDTNFKFDRAVLLTLLRSSGQTGWLDNEDNVNYVEKLFNTDIKLENVRNLGVILKRLEVARNGLTLLDEIKDSVGTVSGKESIQEILTKIEAPLFNFVTSLGENATTEPQPIINGLEELIEHLKSNPREIIGISSGFNLFDRAIGGGFRRKTVSVIGARAKTGKSTLVSNIAYSVASQGIPVLNLDTEMDLKDQQARFLAMVSDVDINTIETGQFSQDHAVARKIEINMEKIKNLPYYHVNVAGMSIEEITSIARRWLFKHVGEEGGTVKNCLVCLDYLKVMNEEEINNNLAEFQRLGFMLANLHNFAVKYDVPVLAMTQLNRDGIDKEHEGVVAGSDRITWFCSSFSIFKIKSKEEMEQDGEQFGNRKLIPVLSRYGEGLSKGDYINIQMTGSRSKIREVGTRSEHYGFPSQNEDDNVPI